MLSRLRSRFKSLLRRRRLRWVSLFLLVVLAIASCAGLQSATSPLYLAVVGPMTTPMTTPMTASAGTLGRNLSSNPGQIAGQQMVQGIELYLQDFNRRGGVEGHPVKLLTFDDQNDPEEARRQAEKIAADPRILAVLGHYYSSTSIAAADIYEKAGLPVITGSATAEAVTAGHDGSFRTIFSNAVQGSFLAHYLHDILNQSQVRILYTENRYGESLAESFGSAWEELTGQTVARWAIPLDDPEGLAQQEEKIVAQLVQARQAGKDLGALFLATHQEEAAPIMVSLRRNDLSPLLLGPDSLGQDTFPRTFADYPEEQAEVGHFSENLYGVAPIIFDVASAEAQAFRDEFRDRYGQSPSWSAATYYDAALVATQALLQVDQAGGLGKGPVQEKRSQIQAAIARSNSPNKAFRGLQGPIYFDSNGDSLQSTPIGLFRNGHFVPALTQLQPITDLRQVADVQADLATGQVIQVNRQYMHRVNIAYTGIDINDVDELNSRDSSYLMDFYLWFRYRGDFKAEQIEFTNLVEPLQISEELDSRDVDGLHYRAYRFKGRFRGDFDLRRYPFDHQSLVVRFRHKDLRVEDLVYVNDIVGMRSGDRRQILKKLRDSKVLDSLPNWRVQSASFFQDQLQDDSTLGNPDFLALRFDDSIRYSRFNASIELQRDAMGFVVKNMLPVFLLMGASYMLLFIPPDGIAPKAGGGLSILLATSFFHVRLSNDLPVVGYLVAIEYIFFSMYILSLFALFISIGTNVTAKYKQEALLERLDRLGKILYPLALLLFTTLFALIYVAYPAWQAQQLTRAQPTFLSSAQAADSAAAQPPFREIA